MSNLFFFSKSKYPNPSQNNRARPKITKSELKIPEIRPKCKILQTGSISETPTQIQTRTGIRPPLFHKKPNERKK